MTKEARVFRTWKILSKEASSDDQSTRIAALNEAAARLETSLARLGYWALPTIPDSKGNSVRPSLTPVVKLICAALPYAQSESLLRAIDIRNKAQHTKGGFVPTKEDAVAAVADYRAFLAALGTFLQDEAQRTASHKEEWLVREFRLHTTLVQCFRKFGLALTSESDLVKSVASLKKAARVLLDAELTECADDETSLGSQAKWIQQNLIVPGLLLGEVKDIYRYTHAVVNGTVGLCGRDKSAVQKEAVDRAIQILMGFVGVDANRDQESTRRLNDAKPVIAGCLFSLERRIRERSYANEDELAALNALLVIARAHKAGKS